MEPRPLAPHRRRLAGVRHGGLGAQLRSTSIAAGARATAPTSRTSDRVAQSLDEHPLHRRLPGRADRHPRLGPSPLRRPRRAHADRQADATCTRSAGRRNRRLDRDGAHRPRPSHAEQLDGEPSVFTIVNTNSPLTLDVPMSHGIIEMARANQVTCVTPFTLAGAMAPITLAGALAQQNAEALAGMLLTQIVRPGQPVHLRRLHQQRRHAVRRAGVRHARVLEDGDRRRPAGAALRRAVPQLATRAPPTPSTPRPRTSRCSRCGAPCRAAATS